MSKILVTGGAGYIGSHAVYAALDHGEEIVVVDDLSTGCKENLPLDDIAFYQADIANAALLDDVLAKEKPDSVLHFAGSIVVPDSVRDPVRYYQNNVSASLSLIEGCLKRGVSSFVFSSSAAVYGVLPMEQTREESECRPMNPYGRSKYMVEQILQDVAAAHDFSYAALRYFNVAGADPKGRTGQSAPKATHLIKICCEAALGLRPFVPVFGTDYETPDGTGVRDFIHVSDLAEAHLAVLQEVRKQKTGGLVLNCGNGRGFSVREVVAAAKRVSGVDFAVREEPRRAGDPAFLVADPTRLKKLTGWLPAHEGLDEMIESALAWERL